MYNTYVNDRRDDSSALIRGILHTATAVQSHVEAKLATVGLSLPKLAALRALREGGDSLPLSQLADRLSCVKSNITQLVDRLEADGFVRRSADANDRRTRLAVLTTAGRVACDTGSRLREESERELLTAFNPDERERLKTLVERLAQSAG